MRSTPLARPSSRQRTGRGRATPRSRLGCVACKRRHVRCDEAHPSCEPCYRLQLQCYYPHRSQQAPGSTTQRRLLPSPGMSEPLSISASDIGLSALYSQNGQDSLQEARDHATQLDILTWSNISTANGTDALRSSWAGEPGILDSLPNVNLDAISNTEIQIISDFSCTEMETLFSNAADLWKTTLCSPDGSAKISRQTDGHFQFRSISPPSDSPENKPLLRIFGKIIQPPTAMLIGGIKKWRYL